MTYTFSLPFCSGQHKLLDPSYQKVERLFKSIITNNTVQVKRLSNEFSHFLFAWQLFPLWSYQPERGLGIVHMFCYTPFVGKMINYSKQMSVLQTMGTNRKQHLRLTFEWVYNKGVKDSTKRSHERGSQIHG